MSSTNLITGRQIAAARDLLKLTKRDLAQQLGLHYNTVVRIEASTRRQRQSHTLTLIVEELQRRGIEFINGRGVMLKKPGQDGPVESESASE
jgi:transcriptional regulator with XRE-family HTH domain